ncbi:MAG: transposase [Hyphomicrobiales bacterium]|nr:transposase [Hyphomicrobiales bacterium]
MVDLADSIFHDEGKARAFLEANRWPDGPVCPHCGQREAGKITLLSGTRHREGLYQCKTCRRQFTVTVGTAYEHSHVPISKWLLAIHLFCASTKGLTAQQLHRILGVTVKTASFMRKRIRDAMSRTHE